MSEMSNHRHDDELDRLLRDEGAADFADLAGALRGIKDGLEEPPTPATAERHLAAITAVAREAAHRTPAPATAAVGAVRTWGLRLRRALGLTAVKVAVGVGAAAAATGGGLAATGNLPDPAQQVVADVAERIGIELPEPARPAAVIPDDGDTGRGRPAEPGSPSTAPGRTPEGSGSDRGETTRPSEVPSRRPSEPGRPHQGDSDHGNGPTVAPGNAGDRGNSPAGASGKADAPRDARSDPASPSGTQNDARSDDATSDGSHGSPVEVVDKGRSALVPPMRTEDD